MEENPRLFTTIAASLKIDLPLFITEKKEELINSLVELESFEQVSDLYMFSFKSDNVTLLFYSTLFWRDRYLRDIVFLAIN